MEEAPEKSLKLECKWRYREMENTIYLVSAKLENVLLRDSMRSIPVQISHWVFQWGNSGLKWNLIERNSILCIRRGTKYKQKHD